jgi:hypothetical protein
LNFFWINFYFGEYIYVARTDDAQPDYYLEINTNLIIGAGVWTNLGYTTTERGSLADSNWEIVTNMFSIDVFEKLFVRLGV